VFANKDAILASNNDIPWKWTYIHINIPIIRTGFLSIRLWFM